MGLNTTCSMQQVSTPAQHHAGQWRMHILDCITSLECVAAWLHIGSVCRASPRVCLYAPINHLCLRRHYFLWLNAAHVASHLVHTPSSWLKTVAGVLTGDAHSHHMLLGQPLWCCLNVKLVSTLHMQSHTHRCLGVGALHSISIRRLRMVPGLKGGRDHAAALWHGGCCLEHAHTCMDPISTH